MNGRERRERSGGNVGSREREEREREKREREGVERNGRERDEMEREEREKERRGREGRERKGRERKGIIKKPQTKSLATVVVFPILRNDGDDNISMTLIIINNYHYRNYIHQGHSDN